MHLRTKNLFLKTLRPKYRKTYREFMVSELNTKLAEKKNLQARIQYIHNDSRVITNVEEMHKYIKTHPNERMIGFILCYPPFDEKDEVMAHVCPVLYVRDEMPGTKRAKHSFIVFDSVLQGILIPRLIESCDKQSDIEQHFYFLLNRQTSERACFEDALRSLPILMDLARSGILINFCEQNSEEDYAIAKRLSLAEKEETAFFDLQGKLSKKDVFRKAWLEQKDSFHMQLESRKKLNESYVDKVHLIRVLPSKLLPCVEHFGTMRMLRSTYPQVFLEKTENTSALETLLKKGQIRCVASRKYTVEEFKANMQTPDKIYDFSGVKFDALLGITADYAQNRSRHVFTLFMSKLNKFPENKFKDKKSDSEHIATKIAKFSGMCR